MDTDLLKMSVDYHGPTLIDCLGQEQPNVELPHSRRSLSQARHGRRLSEDTFQQKLAQLVARKADLLFVAHTRGQHPHISHHMEDDKCCAVVAPLETSMQILSADRRLHCLQCMENGDVVMGVVSAVQEAGLLITLFCLDGGKVRDIDELNITAFCPVSELPRYYAHEGPLEAFTIKDRVRGVVLSVVPAQENVVVSLKPTASPGDHAHVKLGLVDDDDVSLHYRRIADVSEHRYPGQLKASAGFNNPRSVEYLSDMFDLRVNPAPSLMRGLRGVTYPASDYREPLRKTQSYRLALKSVSEGVTHFKAGRHIEAMQYLNKALQIDEENVDALVARGALYANNESYSRAIDDFTAALKLNPHHKNARKYTCETLIAHAKGLTNTSQEEEAVSCLEQALQIDPRLEEARSTLHRLRSLLSRRGSGVTEVVSEVSESEDEREEKAEIQRMSATLRRLIEQDKITSKHRTRRSSGTETNRSHKDRRSSSCKKRKKKKRRSHEDSDDERPVKRGRHSRVSDAESEKSRKRHRSSSVESEKSPVKSQPRVERDRVRARDTPQEGQQSGRYKSYRLSSDNGVIDRSDSTGRHVQPSCVEMAPLSSRRHPADETASGRSDSLDDRRTDRDRDGCSKNDSPSRRHSQEYKTRSRERVNDRAQEELQATEVRPRATEMQHKCTTSTGSEMSQRSRDKSTKRRQQSSDHSHHESVTMATEVTRSSFGVRRSTGMEEGSRRESLDDMENFLKTLKEKKKQKEGSRGTE